MSSDCMQGTFVSMNAYTWVETISVCLSLAFLVLLMRNNKWCWPFGIVGSALGAFLFVWPAAEVKLYSEAILYSYYVWIGVYGWIQWSGAGSKSDSSSIQTWGWKKHLYFILSGCLLAPSLGYIMSEYFSSNNPYIDAATTVFSFIASYMQAKRVLSSWHVWIVINAVSIWLYYQRGLEVYSLLMVVYFALSIAGLFQWSRLLSAQARLRQDVS